MKKRILIVGNTSAEGVDKDIDNYVEFFTNPIGGLWNGITEIEVRTNISKSEFDNRISHYKSLDLDYFIFVFCGHGGSINGHLIMQLNTSNESVNEEDLNYVSNRQLNIFDCCREDMSEELQSLNESRRVCFTDSAKGNVRQRYEDRIMKSSSQCSSLYACSNEECSYGGSLYGGVYTNELLSAARNIGTNEYKTIGNCHNEAGVKVTERIKKQHPDSCMPRCTHERSLILSIHP